MITVDSNGVAVQTFFINPFKSMVSVEVREPYSVIDDDDKFKEFDGMSLETVQRGTVGPDGAVNYWEEADEDGMVELTIRIPEQFFTETYNRADWESSLYATRTNVPGFGVEYLIDSWNPDVEQELYGPDGQQVPLW